jgi:alkylation response protein AidB-like acyl-CoA dehydrogenase
MRENPQARSTRGGACQQHNRGLALRRRRGDVERYFREARLLKIAPLSQEMALNSISEHVLGLPRSY